MVKLNIILCSIEEELKTAWENFCGHWEFVSIYHGSIINVMCDAVISPANSFGFMDGGIDSVYSKHFGYQIQDNIQKYISKYYFGEIPVGNAGIIETNHPHIPFLIFAPTMRVPMILRDSVNPYLAARAAFLLLKHGIFNEGTFKGDKILNHVKTIALPGLGTGIGQVGFNTCAHQVNKAIEDVILEKFKRPNTWVEASENHQLLYTDFPKRLQY
jgi:O-acetyl-ADP-ribose deacetylase (regulator of RNase III)